MMYVYDKKGNRRRVNNTLDLERIERQLGEKFKVCDNNNRTIFKAIDKDVFWAKIR